MSQDKTEDPTAKRRRDARKKGQTARSRDLALAAASVAVTMALARLGGHMVTQLTQRVQADLGHLGDAPLRAISAADLGALIARDFLFLSVLVGPIGLVAIVAGVGMHGFQGGWTLTSEGLKLNWSRLSPATNVKKLGLSKGGVDTLKTFVTAGIIGYLGWRAVEAAMQDSQRLPWLAPIGAAEVAGRHLTTLLTQVGWTLGVIAMADYALQRWRMTSSLKMSKQEVRDEAKQSDGNPEVKGRLRRLQREMGRRRMLADVPRATVVLTNPTHFAVALEYQRGMGAPLVLAKGQDYLALKIRERAREHGVPIVENKALARALFSSVEIGDTIPGPLFAAVAEVLAQLIRFRQITL